MVHSVAHARSVFNRAKETPLSRHGRTNMGADHANQKLNCTPTSMRRGFSTAVGWPKNGDVSTPLYPL